MSLQVAIKKRFSGFSLDVSLNTDGGVMGILGASGSGKSMTLKCIAGIERPDRGRIVVDGVTLFDSEKHIDLTPQRRRTGLMFQNYALFPNMTVAQNIRAGARRERDKAKREALAERLMESFQLQPLAKHYPSQLSGGQQQRVALARILVSDPQSRSPRSTSTCAFASSGSCTRRCANSERRPSLSHTTGTRSIAWPTASS